MKLNFLFLLMDVLTLLAYPIVFVYGRLYPDLKTMKAPATVPAAPQR